MWSPFFYDVGGMTMAITRSEKLRGLCLNAVEVFGLVYRFCFRVAVSTLGFYTGLVLFGLLTADPETTTFRDFLLSLRNPGVWGLAFLLATIWVAVVLAITPPDHYRAASGKASIAQARCAPKKGGE
nr:hypothetical protein [uncultured bacterium]